jgi:hypothetical protein
VWLILRYQRGSAWWRFILFGLIAAIVPASLTAESFHMLRLIAVPVFLLVLTIPALEWFMERINSRRAWGTIFLSLIILTLVQGAIFQWQFHKSATRATRLHLFDAEYRRTIFASAIANGVRPIYLADSVWIPGYIQAYWYATLQGINQSEFVLLQPAAYPPAGSMVITTEAVCQNCQVLAKSAPYTLYIATTAAERAEPLPDDGFRAALSLPVPPARLHVREKITLQIRVNNTSNITWLARGRSADQFQVTLGNHWLDPQGKVIIADDGRTVLPQDLKPGGEIELPLTVNTPRKPGEYILEIDMLQEHVAWFGSKGSETLKLRLKIE